MILAPVMAFIAVSGTAYAADTIKLGCAYGMTGRIGWIGEDCTNGVKLVIDEINARGGIHGKKIELAIYDTKNNPDTARTVFEKLIKKDKVVAICGPVITQATQTVMPVAEKYKIPYAAVSGGIQINAKILPQYLKDNDPQKKVISEFQKRFRAKFGKGPKSWFFAAVGYDSALMFVKAIEAVGTGGEKIQDWLENQARFEGVQAVYSWSDLDHRGIGVDQCSVLQIKGGNWGPAD